MTISRQSLIDRAYMRLLAAGREVSTLKLDSMVGQALELLSKRIAESPFYESTQKDFSITPASGVADLTTLTGILFDLKKSTVRVASSNLKITPAEDLETLERGGLPVDQVYYAQDGNDLRFRGTDGLTTTYATAIKIKSSFIMAITDIATYEYEEALVSTLCEITQSPMAKAEELAGR